VEADARPGPKPKRLFVRLVRVGDADRTDLPSRRDIRGLVAELERVGRLVAHGALTDPAGDLLIIRATDAAEAQRILRADPFRTVPQTAYELMAWNPTDAGTGVNMEPAPGRGSGRLTALQRVTVVVRDQDAALAWYRDVLGLGVRERDAASGFVELSLGKGAAALSLVAPQPRWGEPYFSESVARVGVRTGIAFQTDSVAALELRLRHAGTRVTQGPEPQPWGGVTIRFVDPDGNEFLAFQPGHRGRVRTSPPPRGKGASPGASAPPARRGLK
jgi:catechol 2,3-dioxygenase-like lactoylglutathione lyase family enzyme